MEGDTDDAASPARRWLEEVYLRPLRANDPGLTRVKLRVGQDFFNGVFALADALASGNTVLQELHVATELPEEGVRALCRALDGSTTLSTLSLGYCSLNDGSLEAVASLLRASSSLTSLEICGNEFGDRGLCALGQALHVNRSLRHLELQNNEIGDGAEGWEAFGESLGGPGNTTLTSLTLYKNKLGGCAGAALGAALRRRHCPLVRLVLSYNPLTDAGVAWLAAGLAASTRLSVLELPGCGIEEEGGMAIAEGLRSNASLSSLCLACNGSLDDGTSALIARAATAKTALTHLNMNGTGVWDAGVRAFAGAVLHPWCELRELWLSNAAFRPCERQTVLEIARAARACALGRGRGLDVRGLDFRAVSGELGLPADAVEWDNEVITRYWEVEGEHARLAAKLGTLGTALFSVRAEEVAACRLLTGAEDCVKRVAELCWDDAGELPRDEPLPFMAYDDSLK